MQQARDDIDRRVTEQRNVQELATMSVGRLLRKYFMPSFAGFVVFSLYNVVDRIFIGQGVGSLALAGLSAVYPIMLIRMAFGVMVGIGGSVRASIALGRGNLPEAERFLGRAFVLMLCFGLGFTVLGYAVKDQLLALFGITAETAGYANDYLDIILLSSVFSVVGYSLNNFIRAEGNARIAMLSMFISAGLNTVLDAIFILGFGWGVQGAAWATALSQIVLAVWVVVHFRSKRSLFRLRARTMRFDGAATWSIFTVGFSSFAMHLSSSVVQSTYNVQLVRYGSDYAMSAIGIINSISHLLAMSIVALNQAAQPIYGYSLGAGNYRRLRETLYRCLFFASLIAVVAFVLVQTFPAQIVRLFDLDDPHLLQIGRHSMRVFFAAFPLVGFQIVVGGYFQSVGQAGKSAVLSLLRQLLFLIPLMLLLPRVLGLTGVWLAAPLSDTLSATVCAFFLIFELRRLRPLAVGSP